jgi:thiol:disulfide interchange protein
MKKKIIILFCFATLVIITVSATMKQSISSVENKSDSETGIQFTSISFEEALKLAKKEKKNIFLDAYASWCGPCKMLKKNVFTQKEVGDFYNGNFINMAIDMEQGEGPKLAQKFKVQAYPTLLFINHKGEVVGTALGYHQADEIIALGKKYVR